MTRPTNEYLRFFARQPEGFRTVIVDVHSARNSNYLGSIRWWGPWRQYTFQPSDGTIWNTECLDTIQAYIAALMEERRTQRADNTEERRSD